MGSVVYDIRLWPIDLAVIIGHPVLAWKCSLYLVIFRLSHIFSSIKKGLLLDVNYALKKYFIEEEGRRVARDIGGSDPERMASPRVGFSHLVLIGLCNFSITTWYVCLWVGLSVGWFSVYHNFLKGRELHFHAPIVSLYMRLNHSPVFRFASISPNIHLT